VEDEASDDAEDGDAAADRAVRGVRSVAYTDSDDDWPDDDDFAPSLPAAAVQDHTNTPINVRPALNSTAQP